MLVFKKIRCGASGVALPRGFVASVVTVHQRSVSAPLLATSPCSHPQPAVPFILETLPGGARASRPFTSPSRPLNQQNGARPLHHGAFAIQDAPCALGHHQQQPGRAPEAQLELQGTCAGRVSGLCSVLTCTAVDSGEQAAADLAGRCISPHAGFHSGSHACAAQQAGGAAAL